MWCAAIFVVSSRPGSTLPGGYSVQGHLVEYFILGALLLWALIPRFGAESAVVLAVILGSLYGMTDEFHQHFVAMRTPDVTDWGVDTLGALAGALVAAFVIHRLTQVGRAQNTARSGSAAPVRRG